MFNNQRRMPKLSRLSCGYVAAFFACCFFYVAGVHFYLTRFMESCPGRFMQGPGRLHSRYSSSSCDVVTSIHKLAQKVDTLNKVVEIDSIDAHIRDPIIVTTVRGGELLNLRRFVGVFIR